MKRALLIVVFLLAAAFNCVGQTLRVGQFPGNSVGAKLSNAQTAGCSSDVAVTCVLIIEPELSVFASGNLPTPCVHCYWLDYRNGLALSSNTVLNVTTYGARGDGSTDSSAAVQAAINALPTAFVDLGTGTQANPQSCIFFPAPAVSYLMTATISVSKDGACIEGANYGVTIRNTTSGAAVFSFDSGINRAISGITIRRLTILGTGASSKAVYGNGLFHSNLDYFSMGTEGSALYCESTHAIITGCGFNTFSVIAQAPGGAGSGVTLIYSKGGRSNTFKGRARQAEVGVKLENEDGSVIDGMYIETNNQGTAKTGVLFVDSDSTAVAGGAGKQWVNSIVNTYFENNTSFNIDADVGNVVIMQNVRGAGGITASAGAPLGVMRLNGGARIYGLQGLGTKITSSQGLVYCEECWNVYGPASQLRIKGVNDLPLFAGGVNTATKSWYDTDPTWTNLGSPNPPTLSFDTTAGFYGANSKKAAFPSAASSFANSRTRIDQATTTVTTGDWLTAVVVAKFDVNQKNMALSLRNNGGSSETISDFNFSTDSSDWIIFTLRGKVPSSVTSAALSLFATSEALGGTVNVNVGAVAVAKNAHPVLTNTEWPTRGPYDVDFQVGRLRTLAVQRGVAPDGGGLKHGRVTTGSCATTGCSVTLNWTTAFVDANYTPSCSVEDSTAQSETTGLRLARVTNKVAASVTVAIDNFSGAGVTGTLDCNASHD